MIDVKYNTYNNLINIKIGLMDSLYICLIFSNTNIYRNVYFSGVKCPLSVIK